MRRVSSLLVVPCFLALLAAPLAIADHPDGTHEPFSHLSLDVQELAPGESRRHDLLSPEGPLRAGWVYIIYGGVQGNGTVVVNLSHEGGLTDRFVWEGGGFHHNSTKIQKTGAHELVLWNPGNESVTYAFYYDQSCNCVGKLIPLPGGFVLFNHVFEGGREVQYDLFVYNESIRLRAALAAYDPALPTAHWPEDFEILDEQTVTGKDWINFTFTPPETATYYVFYTAERGASPQQPVHLTPIIEVEKEEEAPALPIAVFLLAGLLVAASRRPSR